MRIRVLLFVMIEIILGFLCLFSLFHTRLFPILIFLGIYLLFMFKIKKKKRMSRTLMVGGVLLVFLLVTNIFFWLMLLGAMLFLIVAMSSGAIWEMPTRNLCYTMVDTAPPTEKSGKTSRNQLFGEQKIGENAFEWDEILLQKFAGDTIIDLGNTILPKEENVVIVRTVFGRTRLLVPQGVGISLKHSTMSGQVSFLEKSYTLNNEVLSAYSEDYDHSTRKIKIISMNLFGALEVIRA